MKRMSRFSQPFMNFKIILFSIRIILQSLYFQLTTFVGGIAKRYLCISVSIIIMSYQKHISITVPIPVRYYMLEMCLTEEASQEEHGMISFDSG